MPERNSDREREELGGQGAWPRPGRRATLRLAAGVVLAGAVGVIRAQPASAAGCSAGDCNNWWDACIQWCADNSVGGDAYKACMQWCHNELDDCVACCDQGKDSSICVPPYPPEEDDLSTYRATLANNCLVAAELGYGTGNPLYGMLRARTSGSAGPWEEFVVLQLTSETVAIRSNANGLYVSAELGYGTGNPLYGMLRARNGTIGSWETFKIGNYFSNNTVSYVLTAANGSYVSAELGYGGSEYAMLRARPNQTSIGPWERFFWAAG